MRMLAVVLVLLTVGCGDAVSPTAPTVVIAPAEATATAVKALATPGTDVPQQGTSDPCDARFTLWPGPEFDAMCQGNDHHWPSPAPDPAR